MIRDVGLQEPVGRPVTRSRTLAGRLDQLKRERVNRKRNEEIRQFKEEQKSKLKAFKAATDSASITVRTDNRNDDSNRGRKRQRSDADRRSAVQPEPPRKKIPPLAGAGTSRDDEQRRKVLRKEWLRVLKFEHTHLLLDMVECLMSRKALKRFTSTTLPREAKTIGLSVGNSGRSFTMASRSGLRVCKWESSHIFTDHFAVNMRRAACVFETTQLPGREMEFLVFVLNEMMQREAETSKELEEAIARLKQKAQESDGKLEDLQNFLDGIGTGTTEAISMQNAADELLEEDVDPPSKSSYTNSVLDGFREKIEDYQSEIQGLKSARDTSEQELNAVKGQNDSLTTEMEEMRVSRDSLASENHQLRAQYNAASEELEELKGLVTASNQKLVDQGATLKKQLETVQIEPKQAQSESKVQTQDTADIAQLQEEASKLRLELEHWNRLHSELFSGGSTVKSEEKAQEVLKLTQGLKRDIGKFVESKSGLEIQAAKIEEADRTAELESRNAVLQGRVADLEKQLHSPPPDINMGEAAQQQAEDNPNYSLHTPANSANESVTTTITVGELKKMSEELQDVNSRLEAAVQANASLQTESAELKNEAEILKANLHACEDAKAKLQVECENLRYPGLLPTKEDQDMQDCADSGTQTMHYEAEDTRQFKAKIVYIEGLQSYIKGLEDKLSQEKEKYILIQKQNDEIASKLLEAVQKVEACGVKIVQERENITAAADTDRQIAELQNRIREKEWTIQELRFEATTKETEHGSIQREINALLLQRNELQRNADEYKKSDKHMKEEIDQLKKQVQDQKENYKNNSKENERILQEKITSIYDLQRQIEASEENVTREKQKQQLMENEKDELALQFSQFKEGAKADAEKLKKEIQDLQERNLKLKSDVEEQAKDHRGKKEEVDKHLKDLIEQVHNLEDEIRNARASLTEKDQELENMKTAAKDVSEKVTSLQDSIERKESEILTLKEKATEQEAEQESMRNEMKNLLSQIADLNQNRDSSKKEHENSVKLFEVEIAQLRNQLDTQAQNCIEAKAELSTCRNEHASQFTKLAESSELTQSRNELYELQNQLQVKDKELARIKKLLDDTEERIASSQEEMEKRHSIIENLPVSLATLRSTVDGIQSMVSAQQQSTYNAKQNCGSLQPEKGAHNDDSKNFAELRNQIQNLEHSIVERCAKNDLEIKVRELQDKIMNLERSGDLLKAEVLIAAARRDDAEAEAAKWISKHKLLEDRLRKTEVQQLLDAKLKVEFEGQESMNRIYEGLRADGGIPALMTEISENNKTLSLFFEQYKSDVDQFKSLHRRLEALGAELRDVEIRVDNSIGVLGSTSVDSRPDIVNPGIGQPDEKVEWRVAKKVSVLIEKAQLKIRNLESALEAKESEAELAALQSEMAVQEADPMHPCLWEEVPSGPRVGTPGSEPDLSFHTPESTHTPIKQCKPGVTEGIEGTQYRHKDSAHNLYPPLPLRTHTKPEPAQAMYCQPVKGLATDRPVLAQRTRKCKARKLGVLEENAGVDMDKSLSDLEGFRMSPTSSRRKLQNHWRYGYARLLPV
ncbi:Delta-aminolevulinic acid dehydratase [Fusarium oxysporum f. sp. albedinis]|nr:Delta-aminolevulinic acid dehydratase [Fusarium oxysporum f. sp. albedinis]